MDSGRPNHRPAFDSVGGTISNHGPHILDRDARLDLGHPPRGTRLGVRRDVAAGGQLDSDVEGCRVIATQVADGRHGLCELIDVVEVDREEAVVAGRPAQRFEVPGECRGPHWYPWSLNRSRQELDIVDEVVLAAMVDRLAGPGSREDLESFIEHLPSHSIVELFP